MSGEPILGKAPAEPHRDYKLLTWPRFLRLRRWAQRVADHEQAPVYLVGSALTKRRPRDLDVSIILPHDRFVEKFGPIPTDTAFENYSDPRGMAAYMQKLHLYLYDPERRYPWLAEDMGVRYTRLDLKICPDSWWPDKDKLLLAAPRGEVGETRSYYVRRLPNSREISQNLSQTHHKRITNASQQGGNAAMGTRCFFLEPTDRVSQKLRRYSHNSHWDTTQQKTVYENPCPITGYNHNAEIRIKDAPVAPPRHEGAMMSNGVNGEEAQYANDPRWPTQCACGYTFTENDAKQVFCEAIYRRSDTGEEMTIRDAPNGAMWYAPWYDRVERPQLEHTLVVKLPDGSDWVVDSRASNCTLPNDDEHHCWVIEGTPPNVSVSKNGRTCGAGAGSIQSAHYHGFLTNGEFNP